MSGNAEEEKESQKTLPLDLARNQMAAVRTVEGKTPIVMTSQSLRGVRVLAQGVSSSSNPTSAGQAIITTNIVPQTMLKQDAGRTQITGIITNSQAQPQVSSNLTLQRPTQITLSTTPLVAQSTTGTSYHVPRGPAVVANLAAPRSNVTTVRTPMVVTAQTGATHAFVRPPRTPSPAQGTAWLNTSNGSQIKGASTVLSSPVRGVTVTGKPQIRAQQAPTMSTIRPGTILQNAITIGQSGQIHSFKPTATNIQGLGNTVTIGQMLPARSQAVVYNTSTVAGQFTPARITVAGSGMLQNQRPTLPRATGQITGARLTVPVNVTQQPRLITPQQATIITSGAARLPPSPAIQKQQSLPSQQQQPTSVMGSTARIVTSQPNVSIGRLSAATPTAVSSTNLLGQARISTLNLHSLVAVANSAQGRGLQAQGAKVITQPAQGTIHLTPVSSQINTSANVVTTGARTINVPAAIVTQQRGATVVPPQAISIAKVFPSSENQGTPGGTTNVFIHAPLQTAQRRTTPSPGAASAATSTSAISQPTITTIPTTTVASYSLASGAYFYDPTATAANYTRPFGQPQATTAFAALSQIPQAGGQVQPQPSLQQQQPVVRAQSVAGQVHGLMSNPQMRFNSVMVVEQSRGQQPPQQQQFVPQSQLVQHHPQVQQSSMVQPQQLQHQQQQSHIQQAHLQQQINQSAIDQHQQLQQSQQHQDLQQGSKLTSSPRPSILRKRDHEGAPLKAAKNLTPLLHSLQGLHQSNQQAPFSPLSPRPDSRGNGHSSGGSTTISATSSPGIPEANDDSNSAVPMNHCKEEDDSKPTMEMSPRKKPRKQQLTNDVDEHNDDMQFISESNVKKGNEDSEGNQSDEPKDGAPEATQVTTVRKPASASLLNSYRQTWKATHNHYQRYSDVRPKDERRPTIMDLANQYRVQDKVNGWKIHHLSTQMEDLAEQEQAVYNQLTELLKCTESEENNKQFDKEINRVNELIKGNLQRIKIINDGMIDAKTQIMKIFDHKTHVMDIINRCASKRNFKKRDKT